MKIIVVGCGSIGKRHIANALSLGHTVVAADPVAAPIPGVLWYTNWRRALADHDDAAGVVIASPTDAHLEQLMEAARARIPAFVEKPLLTVRDYRQLAAEHLLTSLPLYARHVVGFQYLFNANMRAVEKLVKHLPELDFYARDDLAARYGPDVEGAMAAHPLAAAVRLLGPATDVNLLSSGTRLVGHVRHTGGVSRHDYDISSGPRQSWVSVGRERVEMTADPAMYLACLSAWTTWLGGGERDPRSADLALGVEVSRILSLVGQYARVA